MVVSIMFGDLGIVYQFIYNTVIFNAAKSMNTVIILS